jgi:hypothetical protein
MQCAFVRLASVAVVLAASAAVQAQTISPRPMPLDQIAAQSAALLSHDETLKFVSGAEVTWLAFSGGERIWTNELDGSLLGTRIGTGVGSFNPHHKSGRGNWVVNDDGSYCVRIDYGMQMIEKWCWQFFRAADGSMLMHITPEGEFNNNARIAFKH